MTDEGFEESIDSALAKADFNYDGAISWEEYMYSLHDSTDDKVADEQNK